jgi:hypothetical protein
MDTDVVRGGGLPASGGLGSQEPEVSRLSILRSRLLRRTGVETSAFVQTTPGQDGAPRNHRGRSKKPIARKLGSEKARKQETVQSVGES